MGEVIVLQWGISSSSALGENTFPDRMWAPTSEPFSTIHTLKSRSCQAQKNSSASEYCGRLLEKVLADHNYPLSTELFDSNRRAKTCRSRADDNHVVFHALTPWQVRYSLYS
eukprot:scaffold578_cov235-Prasinococcus_capsulatus_cf.AAC.1